MKSAQKDNYTLQGFLDFKKVLRTLGRTVSFAAKHEGVRVFLLIFLAIVMAAVPYFQNGLFGKLIDSVIAYKGSGGGLEGILVTVGFLLLATAAPNVLNLIKTFTETTFRFNLVRQLDLFFLKKIGTLDIASVEGPEYQELSQKMNERGTMTIYYFLMYSIDNFSNFIGVALSLFILGFIDKTLLLYAFVGVIPALYVQLRYGKDIFYIWDLNSGNRRRYFNRKGHFTNLTSLVELKLYQLSKRFVSEIKNILDSFDGELEAAEKNKLMWELFALVVFVVFLGLGLWRILNLALADVLPIGQMLFAYTTYRGFKGTLGEFFRKIGWVTEFSNYSNYWFTLEDMKPKITDATDAQDVDFKHKPPRIEFKNVSFKYGESSDRYALTDLSFTIEPGEKVAVVGLSGAGKTTLIKLLCRVYDPQSGQILINGQDLRKLTVDSWYRQLGVLFQDFATYEFSVRDAIAVGDPYIPTDNDRVIAAAKMANAHDFIEKLPKKYDQLLWKGFEDGVDLSKGERQRMALARVLYRESPITILDEPTASVDALNEQQIFETLEKLPNDRTVILISHRFSTVKNADKILVVKEGKLIEQGTHEDLLKHGGQYEQLYKIQAQAYN